MKFGVTYYPDQWPKGTWDKEFSKIKEIGFSIVRFAEMAWDWVEPFEGKFNFKELDLALDLCEKHGIKVLLGIPVAQAPQWLVSKHREILHVANDGYIHPPYGPRPNACRDNKVFKKYAERLTYKMAQRYSSHPAVLMWQLDNEPNYPPLDLTDNYRDFCHCEATKKSFVEWAKKKYKTVQKLNEKWGAKFWTGTFSSFNEITSPRVGMWDAGNPHIYLDWIRFKSESISCWLKGLKKIIRKYDKQRNIGTNSFTSIVNRIVDHVVIAEEMDFFGWDIYPQGTENSLESLAQIADYWRGVCKSAGSEFIVSELQGGPNVRWGNGDWVSGDKIKEWVELLMAHGASVILFHNWKPPLFGAETGGFGILRPDGNTTERYHAIKETISSYSGDIPEHLFTGEDNQLAIYYSRQSDVQTFQEEGLQRNAPPTWFSGRGDFGLFYGNNSIVGAYRIAYGKKIKPYFLFDKELEVGGLNFKVLLFANPYLISKNQFVNIKKFVEKGGILITECRFGLKDENAHLYEKPLMEDLLGVEHLYTEIIKGEIKVNGEKVCGFRDIVKIKDKEIKLLKNFEDGHPALVERMIGQGKVIYAAFSLFASILKHENTDIIEML